ILVFVCILPSPPASSLFPYTTLFRSLDAVANGLAAFVQRLAQLALRFLQLLKVGFPLQLAAQSIERITRLPQPAPDGARHPGQALRTKHQEGDHENDHHLREADIEHVLPR